MMNAVQRKRKLEVGLNPNISGMGTAKIPCRIELMREERDELTGHA